MALAQSVSKREMLCAASRIQSSYKRLNMHHYSQYCLGFGSCNSARKTPWHTNKLFFIDTGCNHLVAAFSHNSLLIEVRDRSLCAAFDITRMRVVVGVMISLSVAVFQRSCRSVGAAAYAALAPLRCLRISTVKPAVLCNPLPSISARLT